MKSFESVWAEWLAYSCVPPLFVIDDTKVQQVVWGKKNKNGLLLRRRIAVKQPKNIVKLRLSKKQLNSGSEIFVFKGDLFKNLY